MARIRNPILFSEHFGVNPKRMSDLGAFDPTLNVDTKLFVDPLLIPQSSATEFSKCADSRFKSHFSKVIRLLKASRTQGDSPWRQAARFMSFGEVIETCIGYGGASIHGSALGTKLSAQILTTAQEIISLGIEDPELFLLLPLLEEGIGPDRISDMTCGIIRPDLAEYTQQISRKLEIEGKTFRFETGSYTLPQNPCERRPTPILLIPRDVLRHLPIATDWESMKDAADHNAGLRSRVNKLIGRIWRARSVAEKRALRKLVIENVEVAQLLLDLLRSAERNSYNLDIDPEGVVIWRTLLGTVARDYPLQLLTPAKLNSDSVYEIALKVVEQFRHLIEEKGLWNLLWVGANARPEAASQLIFFAVADSYCKANDLDITPEAETGRGPVDFKFSSGYTETVLVEVKLSRNSKLVDGYKKQLTAYNSAEQVVRSVYLIIDVGGMGRKDKALVAARSEMTGEGKPAPEIVFVDGRKKKSASKL